VDRKEAQLILSGLRPGGLEANEPFFAEALSLVETDPELQAWWQAQQEFDRRVAARLQQVPVPNSLRQRCLLSPKIVAYYPPQWQHRGLLAAAAAVAILCVAGTYWHVTSNGDFANNYSAGGESLPVDRDAFTGQALSKLGTSGPLLAKFATNQDDVKEWLKEHKAPIGQMPSKLAALPPIGCQEYVIGGHTVSLVCFTMADGCVVHMFVVDKGALNNPPASTGPQYDSMKGWNIASWSDGQMSYVLATTATMDDLKQLL
jgi:hypothetical protein